MSFDFEKAIKDTCASDHSQPQPLNQEEGQQDNESMCTKLTNAMAEIHSISKNYSYQAFATYLFLSSMLAVYPITSGLAFLEKAPNKFMCERFTAKKMSNNLHEH